METDSILSIFNVSIDVSILKVKQYTCYLRSIGGASRGATVAMNPVDTGTDDGSRHRHHGHVRYTASIHPNPGGIPHHYTVQKPRGKMQISLCDDKP
jgi:hypothetical protein